MASSDSESQSAAPPALTIAALRREMQLTQGEFAEAVGLTSTGRMSDIENGVGPRCSLRVALEIERLSGGRIDAAALSPDVAAARASLDVARAA